MVGQGTGASTALAGERYNRQLHPVELSFIAAKADDYAAYAGISEDEAMKLLVASSLDQLDSEWQAKLATSPDAGQYQAAANWLAAEAAKVGLGFVNENGQTQQAFTISDVKQFYDSTLFDDPYRGNVASKLVDKLLGTSITAGHSITLDDYRSVASELKLEGQYQEWRATRPADVSQWTDEDLTTMVGFVQKNDLRKLAQFGVLGPVGATWVSLSDGDYKTVVDNAALNLATSIVPVGSVGKTAGQVGEAVVDVAQGAKVVDRTAEVVQGAREPTRFIDGVKVVDQKTGQTFQGTVDLGPTLDRIKSDGSFPHRNDGSIFQNRAGDLPAKPTGYYTEYVHPTPGILGPGPQRIVIGKGGEMYYTTDHYKTFIPIN